MFIGKRTRSAALAMTAVVAGSLVIGASDPLQAQENGSTLDRPTDPVVLTGDQVAGLSGVQADSVVGFRASDGAWEQIPVQVDERVETNMTEVYDMEPGTTFYGSSIDIPVTVYADDGTFVGADPDSTVDALDEIAFMAKDAGGAAGDLGAPGGTTGEAVEVALTDPADGGSGYVYLFEGDGSLDPGAGQQYVEYDFNLLSGDYMETYNRESGPNPEASTVTGANYTLAFSDRWVMDELTLTEGDRPGVDIVDRMKYDINLLCVRNEDSFIAEEGAFIANRSGPVRAIRSFVGANSGPNTQNTQMFYEQAVDMMTDLRVHGIPNVRAHLDMNEEAYGMTFRNPDVPDGVTIDGQPDDVPASFPTWWTASGPQGGLAIGSEYDTNATSDPVVLYEDNVNASGQCTGDDMAIGDVGAVFPSWIVNTDPGLGSDNYLRGGFRVSVTGPDTSPEELQRLAGHYIEPLEVSVDGEGGGDPGNGEPGNGECVEAVNSEHIAAGRAATSGLIFARAVGSDDFLGLTSATTALRETEAGYWELVDSC